MMGNMKNLMKQAQQMQEKIAEMQKKLEEEETEGSSGGGLVKVTLNGKGEMKRLSLDESLIVPDDKEVLEDLILAAFNDAKAKVEDHFNEEMSKVTGGMNLPPGMKLPF